MLTFFSYYEKLDSKLVKGGEGMAKQIDVTNNIKECVDILDEYINSDGKIDIETAKNAMKYLKITTDNALSSGIEPKGCPNPRRVERIL